MNLHYNFNSLKTNAWRTLHVEHLSLRVNQNKKKRIATVTRAWIISCITLILFISTTDLLASSPASTSKETIKIGVLAKRGEARALQQWGPTADYLSWMLPQLRFKIVPLDFDAIYPATENRAIDFIITNSAFYVGLAYHYKTKRILTLKNKRLDQETSKFGGVIFTRADNTKINTLKDLHNTHFMAVDKHSFGGWLTARYHLLQSDIVPDNDFKSLQFGGTHDAVVLAVANGSVDAGTVRTDTLERMAKEGKISMKDFKILDQQTVSPPFPFVLSTELYPEWPMAVLSHVDEKITKQVTIALLQLSPEQEAARAGGITGWIIPLDYRSVRQCLQELHFPPFEMYNVITWKESLRQHYRWYLVLVFVLIAAILSTIIFIIFNRRLQTTMAQLDDEFTTNKHLADHLQKFKTTLDKTLDCVFMFNPNTLQYIYANQGAADQVGYSQGELLTMGPLDLKPDLNEKQYRALLDPLIQGQEKTITYTTNHLTKTGGLVPVEILQQYVELSDGKSRFISIVRDISTRLDEERVKEKLQSQLLHAQKLESVGQLAAGIAHEINTPTQFISTNIDFMDEATEDITALIQKIESIAETAPQEIQSPIRQALEDADWEYLSTELPQAINESREGMQRVSSIVMAMKEFSHPGSKEKTIQSLNKIITTTITVARNEWKYVADMETDLDPALPQVALLSDEIGQVILNMLVNAAHAIAEKLGKNPNGEKGIICIATRADSKYVEIHISDTGAGMPESVKSRIFDPFYTTKKVGKGTGQGLAISHDVIVEKHNGTVTVKSVEDVGTTFIIRIPVGNKETDDH